MLRKLDAFDRRKRRVRRDLTRGGVGVRLCVHRSSKHIYAQVIDDAAGTTLASASSQEASVGSGNVDGAKAVGLLLAERAKAKGITHVVFDRGGFNYHGRVKSLADAAREGGLEF